MPDSFLRDELATEMFLQKDAANAMGGVCEQQDVLKKRETKKHLES